MHSEYDRIVDGTYRRANIRFEDLCEGDLQYEMWGKITIPIWETVYLGIVESTEEAIKDKASKRSP